MRLDLGGAALDYSDDGRGMPLVLLHGFANDRLLWRPQVEAFRDRYRVIVPSLRGFGESTGADGAAIAMDRYADDVARLMDHLEIRTAVIAGISLGGYVALAFALAFPGRVRGLVLANTRAGADSPEALAAREEMARQVQLRGAEAAVELLGDRPFAPAAPASLKSQVRAMFRRQATPGLLSATRGMAARPDRTPALGSIRAPVLVIHGSDDRVIATSEAEHLHRAIAGSRFANIAGAGHLSNLDSPAQFNQVLAAFLDSLLGRR
jgi:pimeloyl-ACP methyl ester carboxylesterase